jgi:hypothetical protein
MAHSQFVALKESPTDSKLEDTTVICDYSRATQYVCEPIAQCTGGLCGCAACICGPFVMCAMLCSNGGGVGSSANDALECTKMGNGGNECGIFLARGAIRFFGAIVGTLCYPCEKINRNTETAKLSGNQYTLFCCPVSKEKTDSIDCSTKPKPLFESTPKTEGPARQTMS